MALNPKDDPQRGKGEVSAEDAANLRFLRRLVTILTVTMIVGVIAIVALLVIRLNQPAPSVTLPAQISLPEDTQVVAVTQTNRNILVVTEDELLLIFNASGTELIRSISLAPLADPMAAPSE
ncbi:MAG: DUF6476 family protein [Pseudomonadota bacterium]